MSTATTVKEAVKGTLIGSTDEPVQSSAQTKARFNRHAVKDEESGELYLGQDQFIDAVAPPNEDYVSLYISATPGHAPAPPRVSGKTYQKRTNWLTHRPGNYSTRSNGNNIRSSFASPIEQTRVR